MVPNALRFAARGNLVYDWTTLATQGVAEPRETPKRQLPSAGATKPEVVLSPVAHHTAAAAATASTSTSADESQPSSQQQSQQGQSSEGLPLGPCSRVPPFIRFPLDCAEAIAAFWKGDSRPVAAPYHRFFSFLERHPKGGDITSKWGYEKPIHLLWDAQAAGLLWTQQVAGKQWEIAPVPSHSAYFDPGHVLYWQALGFSPTRARAYGLLSQQKRWRQDETVRKLARLSPHFDPELHAAHYYQSAGKRSWWVRQQREAASVQNNNMSHWQGFKEEDEKTLLATDLPPGTPRAAAEGKRAAPEGTSYLCVAAGGISAATAAASGSSDAAVACPPSPLSEAAALSAAPALGAPGASRMPPGCAAAVADFWKAHGSDPLAPSAFCKLAAFVNKHPSGGSITKKWGYKKLVHFLRDAQAAGLLWTRMTPRGEYEVVPIPAGGQLSNPGHILYWQALGFQPWRAKTLVQLVGQRRWDDKLVARLARTSPHFEPDLYTDWFYRTVGNESWWVRTGRRQKAAVVVTKVQKQVQIEESEAETETTEPLSTTWEEEEPPAASPGAPDPALASTAEDPPCFMTASSLLAALQETCAPNDEVCVFKRAASGGGVYDNGSYGDDCHIVLVLDLDMSITLTMVGMGIGNSTR